jgi:hypothetical protein
MKKIFFLSLLVCNGFINLVAQDYYRTPSGAKYHLETCRMVENTSHRLSLQQAKEMGLKPCKICKPLNHGGTIRRPKKTPGQSKQKFQCIGKTKKGKRCRHVTKIANSYCYQHKPR